MGHDIGYEEDAIAWTEAPDRLKFAREAAIPLGLWHAASVCASTSTLCFARVTVRVGFIALPNVWIFQILFPLISPVMDLMLVYTLLVAGLDRLQQPVGYSSTALRQDTFHITPSS